MNSSDNQRHRNHLAECNIIEKEHCSSNNEQIYKQYFFVKNLLRLFDYSFEVFFSEKEILKIIKSNRKNYKKSGKNQNHVAFHDNLLHISMLQKRQTNI